MFPVVRPGDVICADWELFFVNFRGGGTTPDKVFFKGGLIIRLGVSKSDRLRCNHDDEPCGDKKSGVLGQNHIDGSEALYM